MRQNHTVDGYVLKFAVWNILAALSISFVVGLVGFITPAEANGQLSCLGSASTGVGQRRCLAKAVETLDSSENSHGEPIYTPGRRK